MSNFDSSKRMRIEYHTDADADADADTDTDTDTEAAVDSNAPTATATAAADAESGSESESLSNNNQSELDSATATASTSVSVSVSESVSVSVSVTDININDPKLLLYQDVIDKSELNSIDKLILNIGWKSQLSYLWRNHLNLDEYQEQLDNSDRLSINDNKELLIIEYYNTKFYYILDYDADVDPTGYLMAFPINITDNTATPTDSEIINNTIVCGLMSSSNGWSFQINLSLRNPIVPIPKNNQLVPKLIIEQLKFKSELLLLLNQYIPIDNINELILDYIDIDLEYGCSLLDPYNNNIIPEWNLNNNNSILQRIINWIVYMSNNKKFKSHYNYLTNHHKLEIPNTNNEFKLIIPSTKTNSILKIHQKLINTVTAQMHPDYSIKGYNYLNLLILNFMLKFIHLYSNNNNNNNTDTSDNNPNNTAFSIIPTIIIPQLLIGELLNHAINQYNKSLIIKDSKIILNTIESNIIIKYYINIYLKIIKNDNNINNNNISRIELLLSDLLNNSIACNGISGLLEYILAEIIELAGNYNRLNQIILSSYIIKSIINDKELLFTMKKSSLLDSIFNKNLFNKSEATIANNNDNNSIDEFYIVKSNNYNSIDSESESESD